MLETVEVKEKKPTGRPARIPAYAPTVVTAGPEKLYVLIRFWLQRIFLIWKYFGHPFKIIEALGKLGEVKRKFWSGKQLVKLQKVDGKYFFAMNGPSIFSKGFRTYFLSEVNRIYNKYPLRTMRVLLLGITRKCTYQCEHCYEWDNLENHDSLTDESLVKIVSRFQERGVGQIQLGGGEPMLRYESIINILKNASNESEFNVVTSGFQLTEDRAVELKKHGLTSVTVSLDHVEPHLHNSFRGYKEAFSWAMTAIDNAKQAGLLVNLSLCATREFVSEINLTRYAELAKKVGASFIWIVEAQSAGRYKNQAVNLQDDQIETLESFFIKMNFDPDFKSYPGVAYTAYHQRRLGCFGSGDRYLYIDTNGQLKPCPMCGSEFGKADSVDLDTTIASMRRQGCSAFAQATV